MTTNIGAGTSGRVERERPRKERSLRYGVPSLPKLRRRYSLQTGFALLLGMVGEGGRNSSGVTKFVVSLCLSSAWRPTGFKPLRVVESTERGREQGGGGERRSGGGKTCWFHQKCSITTIPVTFKCESAERNTFEISKNN